MKHATLWKRILNEGITNPGIPESGKREIQRMIINAPIIVNPITVDALGMEGEDWGWEKYTSVSIPFNEFWIEGHDNRGTNSGALVTGGWHDKQWVGCAHIVIASPQAKNTPISAGIVPVHISGTGSFQLLRTNSGLQVAAPDSNIAKWNAARQERVVTLCYTELTVILDVLSLLACKNVSLSPRPMEISPREVRHARKKGDPDYFRYHILVVRPPGARADDHSQEQEIGIMPRHVCRGHFAEYGPEFGKGLLFGRYAGRFFIPPHLKGRKENGVVEKDYEIGG